MLILLIKFVAAIIITQNAFAECLSIEILLLLQRQCTSRSCSNAHYSELQGFAIKLHVH